MTISTYAELVAAVPLWTANYGMSAHIDEFIDSVEAIFNRRLRIRDMEDTTTAAMTSGNPEIALPSGFLEMRSLTYVPVASAINALEFRTLEQIEAMERVASAGPAFYTFANGAIRISPTPDANYSYTARYYKQIVPLDGTNTTNYLLTNHSDAYLAGVLAEAFAFLRDFDAATGWTAKFEAALTQIKRSDARERFKPAMVNFDAEILGPQRSHILTDEA